MNKYFKSIIKIDYRTRRTSFGGRRVFPRCVEKQQEMLLDSIQTILSIYVFRIWRLP